MAVEALDDGKESTVTLAIRSTLLLLGGAGLLISSPDVVGPSPSSPQLQAHVAHVVDGDTIIVTVGGAYHSVRYLGVDAPEVSQPERKGQPFAAKAAAFNQDLVEGLTVLLERDVTDKDEYGRLLRYVWLSDGRLVNAVLLEEGFARAVAFPPDDEHSTLFARLERDTREARRGLWASR